MTERGIRARAGLSVALMMLGLVGLGVRLVFLHTADRAGADKKLEKSRNVELELSASRGEISDRRGPGHPLALNLPVSDVCLDPTRLGTNVTTAGVVAELARILEADAGVLGKRVAGSPSRCFAYVERCVPRDRALQVAERGIRGVFLQDSTIRYYPQDDFMCHVLGFVNRDGVGSSGVEQQFDRYLRGNPGLLASRVDALRQELFAERSSYIAPLKGAQVCLTLDEHVQYTVERVLDETVAHHKAKGGWAIVQKVKTGEILAMVSRPGFSLNGFADATPSQRLNRSIGCVYEPGSTLKAIVISAALNEKTVSATTVFDCENGSWMHQNKILRDYHPYDRLNVADGLKKSSNILTAKVALTLGGQRHYNYLRAFRLGTRLGLDLPGEETGILRKYSDWSGISASRIAIGQGVAVTSLQLLGVYCAIANDGKMMRPYVVDRVVGSDGSVLVQNRPEVIGQPIRPDTAAEMRRLLGRVTEQGGTGTRARVDGYTVAGKTGTAQKPVDGHYPEGLYIASFVGFLPAEEPEIGMIVVVDEPQPLHTGGVVSAPAFGQIAAQLVRYMAIPPSDPDRLGGEMLAQTNGPDMEGGGF